MSLLNVPYIGFFFCSKCKKYGTFNRNYRVPNGDGNCVCPGNTIDYGNGNCSCPGDTVIDEVGHCSCPGDTVNDGLGTCSCPENTMNDGDGNCLPTNPGEKCCEMAKVTF